MKRKTTHFSVKVLFSALVLLLAFSIAIAALPTGDTLPDYVGFVTPDDILNGDTLPDYVGFAAPDDILNGDTLPDYVG